MKKKLMIICLLGISGAATPQAAVTLGECYRRAASVSAIAGEKDYYSEISRLKDKNFTSGWLPTLDAGGSIVYNSEVVDLGSSIGKLPVPGIADAIKPLPHEQYKLSLEINQVIYDGGAIKSARNLEKADLRINEKQTESDLYKLRSQINTWFFSVLLAERQKALLDNYLELIVKRLSAMQSAQNNGMITRSDIDILMAEKIKLEQQLSENRIRKNSLIMLLSETTGINIDASSLFVIPETVSEMPESISRPELEAFDLRKEQIDASLGLIKSKRMPKAYGFATLGYGNPPGNNFFRDEFAPYYIVGAGIKWNIFDWNKVKNEKQIAGIQQSIVESRKTDLTENLKRMLIAKEAEILNLKSLIETDIEIISLRKRITETAESQYQNGIITATDFLNEINSEKQAVLNYEIHKINLSLAQVEYLNISGKEID